MPKTAIHLPEEYADIPLRQADFITRPEWSYSDETSSMEMLIIPDRIILTKGWGIPDISCMLANMGLGIIIF